ncbi:hypothetical protein LB941_04720 [Ligilactobacillus sp. WILCCON 0076]|uniref:Uncharacterized protein n=1 Tax=Ligilactobacillus ubinensis TaxID=2876789 RepID=A0A9X2FIU0_9LACO|nr:hypothetical protein [Ligilactobacillus ubinensis]MCP0886639.1 hypothetical protein [Ligilactobacillus ubinensis]
MSKWIRGIAIISILVVATIMIIGTVISNHLIVDSTTILAGIWSIIIGILLVFFHRTELLAGTGEHLNWTNIPKSMKVFIYLIGIVLIGVGISLISSLL